MPNISVISHEFSPLFKVDASNKLLSRYLLAAILHELKRRGRFEKIVPAHLGTTRKTDIAVLHVDSTIVSSDYLEYAATFPLCINSKVADISKRGLSENILSPDSIWRGPVIVKSNLNCNGAPEVFINKQAVLNGRAMPYPTARRVNEYKVYSSYFDVPAEVFDDLNLVVEKFIPEIDEEGFGIRHWVFCGDAEHCHRYVSRNNIIKADNIIHKYPVPVPEKLRIRRQELGFDYGKFDFVMHQGEAILFDVNKTPGIPPYKGVQRQQVIDKFADGLESLIDKHMG